MEARVEVDQESLTEASFTGPAVIHYKKTVESYAQELFARSVQYGEGTRSGDLPLEVSQEHVRSAAALLRSVAPACQPTGFQLFCSVMEYVMICLAGVSASHLSKGLGILGFGFGLAVGVLLIVVRLTKGAR